MILAAPEFDTYDSIRRFAANPNNRLARRSFNLLLYRTELKTLTEAASRATSDESFNNWIRLALGTSSSKNNTETHKDLKSTYLNMSKDERMEFMKRCMMQVGLNPSAYNMNTKNTQEKTSTVEADNE